MTDCAMAIEPGLEDKKAIIENAVELMRRLGYDCPRVALISAPVSYTHLFSYGSSCGLEHI